MSKMYPKFQNVVRRGGRREKNVIVTEVVINDATSSFFTLPDNVTDVKELVSTRTSTLGSTDATFYLSGAGNCVVNIDGGTLGATHVFAARIDRDLSDQSEGS